MGVLTIFFVNNFPSYLCSFCLFSYSILPAVYCLSCTGVLDCSPAIHQGSAFHYLVQSVETKNSFWLPWLIPPPPQLPSAKMFHVFFIVCIGSAAISLTGGKKIKINTHAASLK